MPRRTRIIAAQLLGQAALGQTAAGPRLIIVSGPDAGRSLPVAEGDTVGRARSAEVLLRDPAASRRHVRVERSGGKLAVVDLGSKNGVELNGHRVRGRAPLQDGDLLRVGATVLEAAGLDDFGPPDSPEDAAPAADSPAGRMQLLRAGAAALLAIAVALAALAM